MKRRKWSREWTPEKKELLITTSIVTLFVVITLVLLGFMSYLLISSESLRVENAVERAFNDVIIALQQGEETIPETMQNRNVLGFGYYTPAGNPIYLWGDAYQRLPFSLFDDNSVLSDTLISINRDSGRIECMRYAEDIKINAENIFSGNRNGVLGFPDVIFLSFDASSFIERMALTRAVSLIAIIVIIIIYLLILSILRENRKYRETLRKQENLVGLGEAARTLTHEIKNPLSAIRIQLAILKREVDESILPDVLVIDNETDRLTKLTDKVSEFLHNPIGHPEEVDLISSMQDLLPLFKENIKWVEPSFSSAPVLFDKMRLRSVLENLLKNAIEASEEGPVDIEAEISADKEGFYHVFIRDRGKGIRKEDEKRIFDPFFTTKIHGSGIGLSISSRFVSAAGGTLRLYPRQDGGTIAEVRLPRSGRRKRNEGSYMR